METASIPFKNDLDICGGKINTPSIPSFGNELTTLEMPWQPFATSIHDNKLAIGSFIQKRPNFISLFNLSNNNTFEKICDLYHDFPPCQVKWSATGLLASCSQMINIYKPVAGQYDDNPIKLCNGVARKLPPNATAPITAIDWNPVDAGILGASSIDTTCTIWQVETGQVKTQLIAHDKQVFDISFANSPHLFATAGGDGSIRIFDLRHLEHSTILYEESNPLLRVKWNNLDSHYLAAFGTYSRNLILLDTRVPSVPIAELEGHTAIINDIAWSKENSNVLASGADDGQLLVWDISDISSLSNPTSPFNYRQKFSSSSEVQQLSWINEGSSDIIFTDRSSVLMVSF